MTPRALLPAIALAATLMTSGCTANDDEAPSVTPSQSPTSTTSGASEILVETEEDIDIGGGRALFLRCWGEPVEDEPTVLLLSGHGLDTGSWTLMASEFANEGHHLCAYDRLGVGRSDFPPPQARRTLEDQVADLVALLDAADLQEPVVLAAHSIGSLTAVGLVNRAPERVAGVVLVDPLSPRVSVAQRAALPPETSREPQLLAEERAFLDDFLYDPAQNRERLLLAECEAQAAATLDQPGPLFGNIPVVLLQAPFPRLRGIPADYDKITRRTRLDGNAEFVAESTQGSLVEVGETGHHIQADRPEVVMDAIRDVIAG